MCVVCGEILGMSKKKRILTPSEHFSSVYDLKFLISVYSEGSAYVYYIWKLKF